MEIIDELHSKTAWLEAIEGMTFFGIPVSEMNEEGLRQLVGFLVTEKRIMGFQPSYWRRKCQPKPTLTTEEREALEWATMTAKHSVGQANRYDTLRSLLERMK